MKNEQKKAFPGHFTLQESFCIFNWFLLRRKHPSIVLLFILNVSLLLLITLQLVIEGVCNNGPDCDIGITKIEVLPSQCPDTWQKGKCKK